MMCQDISTLTRRQVCWWCRQVLEVLSPLWALSQLPVRDQKPVTEARKLCAVFVPPVEPKQSLFPVGAVGQDFPLN